MQLQQMPITIYLTRLSVRSNHAFYYRDFAVFMVKGAFSAAWSRPGSSFIFLILWLPIVLRVWRNCHSNGDNKWFGGSFYYCHLSASCYGLPLLANRCMVWGTWIVWLVIICFSVLPLSVGCFSVWLSCHGVLNNSGYEGVQVNCIRKLCCLWIIS